MAMADNKIFCVATIGEANWATFHATVARLPGEWHLFASPDNLDPLVLTRLNPRAIFFPHWRWKVPPEIVSAYECVAFHSTDLPFGRGGSPIQNMIQLGKSVTKLTAFRMTDAFDAGPVYMQSDLSLVGPLHQILERAATLVGEMIATITKEWPTPTPQSGEATYFRRRAPSQSDIDTSDNCRELYDLIRMLDAPDYPHAFVESEKFRIEFRDVDQRADGTIEARVTIKEKNR
jgi:methionyl-tRNA formyltransferase